MLKVRARNIDYPRLVEWECPNCGKQKFFIMYPRYRCMTCLAQVPSIIDLMNNMDLRYAHYKSGESFFICSK